MRFREERAQDHPWREELSFPLNFRSRAERCPVGSPSYNRNDLLSEAWAKGTGTMWWWL